MLPNTQIAKCDTVFGCCEYKVVFGGPTKTFYPNVFKGEGNGINRVKGKGFIYSILAGGSYYSS